MERARGLVLLQRVWIESRSLSISSIIRFLDPPRTITLQLAVFKAHRLLYHSRIESNSRLESNKEEDYTLDPLPSEEGTT